MKPHLCHHDQMQTTSLRNATCTGHLHARKHLLGPVLLDSAVKVVKGIGRTEALTVARTILSRLLQPLCASPAAKRQRSLDQQQADVLATSSKRRARNICMRVLLFQPQGSTSSMYNIPLSLCEAWFLSDRKLGRPVTRLCSSHAG